MSQSMQTRLSDWIIPPRAAGAGAASTPAKGVLGSPVTVAVSSTAVVIDLTQLAGVPQSTSLQTTEGSMQRGAVGHYVTLTADGCDIYFITGPTFASVSAANAPLARTVQVPTGTGATVATAQSCQPVAAGMQFPMMPMKDVDQFIAIVTLGAATGFATLVQSSP